MASDAGVKLRDFLGLAEPVAVPHRTLETAEADGVTRSLVAYEGLEGDAIRAFLFMPAGEEPVGGVVAFHQHAGAFHLGKSEVAGLAGEPLQAVGPALAARGVAVLAPDAITFEDRRAHTSGTAPTEDDWLQHYNALAYRLIHGETLLRKVLDDAQRAVSVLASLGRADPARLGVVGHSYGGTTALYHAAVDRRIRFACASGSVVSFAARQRMGTGINMAEVVPGIATVVEAHDLVRSVAPRPLLVVSATDDPYSADADKVVARASSPTVETLRVEGDHALDRHRFEAIIDWVARQAA